MFTVNVQKRTKNIENTFFQDEFQQPLVTVLITFRNQEDV
jgi:hypothetical protein